MKITAQIADDKRPEGWTEIYHEDLLTEVEARALVEGFVRRFNAELFKGELPRRLISLSIQEMVSCPHCEGTGKDVPHCETCGGHGWEDDPSDGGTMTCTECGDETCHVCGGDLEVPK